MEQKNFNSAVAYIKDPANKFKKDLTNEEKLSLYKFYKQTTEGDVKGSQPWAVQLEKRAKWDAWNTVKGTSKEDAAKAYVELVEGFKKTHK